MMDKKDDMKSPSSGSYHGHQGSSDSAMGSPPMNRLSSPPSRFQSNTGGQFIGPSMMSPYGPSATQPHGPSGTPPYGPSATSPHGLSAGSPPPISVGIPPGMQQSEPVRRKRGRPRKYGREGAISSSLSASTSSPVPFVRPTLKKRGRPPGTGRSQGGSPFSGPGKLIPQIMTVAAGEDVRTKILSFAQTRQSSVVITANGTISAINIRMSSSAGSVTYEGRFDILTLSGSYVQDDTDAALGPVGYLNVTLACPDGRVMGGAVDGVMLASSPVQVILAGLLPRAASKTTKNTGEASGSHEDDPVGSGSI